MKRRRIRTPQLLIFVLTSVCVVGGCAPQGDGSRTTSPDPARHDSGQPAPSETSEEERAQQAAEKEAADAIQQLAHVGASPAGLFRRDGNGRIVGLDLSATSAKDADLALLSRLPKLETAKLTLPDISDEGLRHLVGLKRLRVLDLEGTAVTNAGIGMLTYGDEVDREKSAAPAGVVSLEEINLKRTGVSDAAFQYLSQMPKIKRIRAGQTYITDRGLEYLKDKTNLEFLDVRECNLLTDAGMAHLRSLLNLRDLKVWGARITNTGVENFSGMQNLRALSLQETAVDDTGLQHLQGLKNLEELTLFGTRVTNQGLAALAGFVKLRKLDLRRTAVDGTGLVHLRPLTNLQTLDLSESRVGNAGLEHLQSLTKLADLNLWATRVGDAGIPTIATLSSLKRLNLDHVGFPEENIALTDQGVLELAKLKNLEWIHMGKTQVGDAGLEALAALPQLKELIVTFCPNVTEAGARKLQAARPELRISR